jgi:hypothetical protein
MLGWPGKALPLNGRKVSQVTMTFQRAGENSSWAQGANAMFQPAPAQLVPLLGPRGIIFRYF